MIIDSYCVKTVSREK